jgi:DNA-binding response OmpR family regulator
MSLLLIEPDEARLTILSVALRAAAIEVVGITRIAEVERWPSGDIVVTTGEHFCSWWRDVGASAVIVLSDTPEQGIEACAHGGTAWILRNCPPLALVALVRSLRATAST